MGGNRLQKCQRLLWDFFNEKKSIKSLEIILDIYYDIIHLEVDQESARTKLFRVLYNLKESSSLDSILGEEDMDTLKSLLDDVLKVSYDGKEYHLENQTFAQLTLDELYQILLETKYLKKKQNIKDQGLPI